MTDLQGPIVWVAGVGWDDLTGTDKRSSWSWAVVPESCGSMRHGVVDGWSRAPIDEVGRR